MPSNYVTSGEASPISPDTGIVPEVGPILELPADGETANVASIAQQVKTLGNYVARLMKPRGVASLGGLWLQRWRTAIGHTRFALDRHGMPVGTLVTFDESWAFQPGGTNIEFGLLKSGATVVSTRWRGIGASGEISVQQCFRDRSPSPASITQAQLLISAGNTAGFFGAIGNWAPVGFTDDTDIAMDWVGSTENNVIASTTPEVQFGFSEQATERADDITIGNPRLVEGAFFVRENTGANWFAVCRNAGVETKIDTGVAATAAAKLRFRIEWRGANVSDSATRHMRFLMDGLLKATITTNLPPIGMAATPVFSARNTSGATIVRPGAWDATVGPVHLVANVVPSYIV